MLLYLLANQVVKQVVTQLVMQMVMLVVMHPDQLNLNLVENSLFEVFHYEDCYVQWVASGVVVK